MLTRGGYDRDACGSGAGSHVMPIELTQEQRGTINRVTLTGSLDVSSVTEANLDVRFNAAVAARREPTLVDLSGVDTISSIGMGVLVSCAASLRRRGVGMVLACARPTVATALRTARIDQVVPLAETEHEALQVLQDMMAV